MRLLRKVVFDLFPGSTETYAKQNLAYAAMGVPATSLGSNRQSLRKSAAALLFGSSSTQQSLEAQPQAAAWDALPAPALILVAAQLPRSSLPCIRMVCKTWAEHVTEVLTETMLAPFPSTAYEASQKDGELMCMLCC